MTLPLPSSCEGCPFYKYKDHETNGFVPDYVVPNSEVYFIAQNPGRDEILGHKLIRRNYKGLGRYDDEVEVVQPQPLVGYTGKEFDDKYLKLAGLSRSEVSVGNAIRCRPGKAMGLPKADDLPTITSTMRYEKSRADVVNAIKHCKAAHFKPPPSTKVLVTMGRHAQFAMTGITKDEDEFHKKQSPLESWRGYAVATADITADKPIDTSTYHDLQSGTVVFMTMHTAGLNYGDNKRFTHAVMQDFYKLRRLLDKEWPEPLPQWSAEQPTQWPTYSAFDTEYDPDTRQLHRWSLCDTSDRLYCIEHTGTSLVNKLLPQEGSTVVIQNALADIAYLSDIIDVRCVKIEDLMLAHSVLWTGEPHSLNYINSIYGTLNRYKHLSSADPSLYSALDSWEPMKMWKRSFIPQFRDDKQSWHVYKTFRLPLINIIDKAQQSGVDIDSGLLGDVMSTLTERLEYYRQRAVEITGNPNFNIGGSKQMREAIYGSDY